MTVDQPGNRYTMPRVYQYITAVEVAYGVSLKPWVNFGAGTGGAPVVSVACWGSGAAFDLIPTGIQPYLAVIHEEEEHALAEALYWAANYVERLLAKVREPIGARPSL